MLQPTWGAKRTGVLLFSGSSRHRCQGREDDVTTPSPMSAFQPRRLLCAGSGAQCLPLAQQHSTAQPEPECKRGLGPGGKGCQGGASFLTLSAALRAGPHRSVSGEARLSLPLPQQSRSSQSMESQGHPSEPDLPFYPNYNPEVHPPLSHR